MMNRISGSLALLALAGLFLAPCSVAPLFASSLNDHDNDSAAPAASSTAASGDKSSAKAVVDDPNATLRGYADKMDFMIGNTMQHKHFMDPPFQATLGKEFNAAETIIFPKFTEPQRGRFDFEEMDSNMKYARSHNMKLVGHVLIYRNNNPMPWLHFEGNPRCGGWSPGDLDRILHDHIVGVVRHGGDAFKAWIVVNEPTSQGGNGCWSRILGEEGLIVKAFKYAREATPDQLLILNDTMGQEGADRGRVDTFFDLVDRCKRQGAPIDMVGLEMHIEADRLKPNYIDEIKYYLDRARKSGVQVLITEMDVYQGAPGSFPDLWDNQRKVYYNVTRACLDDSNCKGLFTWGVADYVTWLRDRPGKVFPDAKPLLFDDDYSRKPAYYGVLQALKEGRR